MHVVVPRKEAVNVVFFESKERIVLEHGALEEIRHDGSKERRRLELIHHCPDVRECGQVAVCPEPENEVCNRHNRFQTLRTTLHADLRQGQRPKRRNYAIFFLL